MNMRAVGDDLVALKPLGDAAHALALRNHHHGGGRQRARAIELKPDEREEREQNAGREKRQHEQGIEKGEHRVHAPGAHAPANSGGRTGSSASEGLRGGVSKLRIAPFRTLARIVVIRRRREVAGHGHCPDAPCGKCLFTWRENMAKGRFGWQARTAAGSGVAPAQDQRGVGPAKAEGIRQHRVDRPALGLDAARGRWPSPPTDCRD